MVRHPYSNLTNDGDLGGRLTNKSSISTTGPSDSIDLHDDFSNNSYDFHHSDHMASAITSDGEIGEFEWNKEMQGIVLGSMFWGYLCLQIPCGMLAERFGPRYVTGIGLMLCSASALVSPVAARINVYMFVVIRILTGAFVSVLCTSVPAFWIHWAPKSEISTLQGIAFAGIEVGIALVFPLSGILCRSGIDGGWPSVFYVTGGLGLAWSLAWLFLSRDNPRDQPWISVAEKTYIEQTTKSRIHAKKVMPWGDMLRSRATWTLICTHTLYNYAYYMLQLQLPSYFNEVMYFDIQSNGLLVMMPYICTGLSMFLGGWVTDVVIRKQILSRDNTRKIMNTIGSGLHAILMIILAQLDSRSQIPAVVLLCLAGALNGLSLSGVFLATFVEIALVHSATLFAVSNTIASIPGIVAPYVVSVLTPTGSQSEWQSAFYVAAAVLLMSTIVFLFSTSAPQPWALPPAEDATVVDGLNVDRKEDAL
ncbi:sialin-like [Haliotis rubra]|uniref:sialin-like n=1 Tax=Haliotis rubra TaxID=36100 RepID=UPI001EE5C991|nr:sialin-like [Haliotis rubra]